ncbi:hypothetical protein A6F59_16850 [Prescottella equi]|nr:hypothetical protein A6F59_16850 [Prescottella equi]
MTTYTVTARGYGGSTTIQIELTGAGATAVAKVARAINEASEFGYGPLMHIATGEHELLWDTEADL